MIAIDTNIVVRLIVADDERQLEQARALADRTSCYVSLTVLIETEWVLRSAYGYNRMRIVAALVHFYQAFDVTFENAADVRWAFERYAERGELADYLHLSAARTANGFATFERRLAARAGADCPVPIETLV